MTIQVPTFENRITLGSLASLVGLIVTVVGFGVAIGGIRSDVDLLMAERVQSSQDSRAIISIQADVRYLKEAFDDFRSFQQRDK
jgi:hypothetical protein